MRRGARLCEGRSETANVGVERCVTCDVQGGAATCCDSSLCRSDPVPRAPKCTVSLAEYFVVCCVWRCIAGWPPPLARSPQNTCKTLVSMDDRRVLGDPFWVSNMDFLCLHSCWRHA
ncbi:unnamed protein product, partial [Ectocarpus fasciculatus]